jgi:hypothetical protein
MDIEKLTKSQIVLLTLLVSFVTSIATGIVAVTLMEQAPPAITQTVNRIVERTVEKVIPSAEGQVAAASTIAPQQVIVREGELIAKAVAAIDPSIVRLYTPGKDEVGKDIQLFVGIAIVANSGGVLLADAGTPSGSLTGLRSDGIEVPLTVMERTEGSKIIKLQGATSTEITVEGKKEKKDLTWAPATFKAALSSIGETVVVISGRTSTKIGAGIITASDDSDIKKQTLETNIAAEAYVAGSPLLSTDGHVIGMATREMREAGVGFLASPSILLYSEPKAEESADNKHDTVQ